MIWQTAKDVLLCSAATVGIVAFCLLGRAAAFGKNPLR
jgi:hypothetical protein